MRIACFILLALAAAVPAFAAGLPSVTFDGNSYSNINKVYVAGSRVIILYPGGGTSTTADKLPADFVSSWLNAGSLDSAKASQSAALDRAIAHGFFREVGGTVYDVRRAPGWASFPNAKVFQIVDDGALVDTTPNDSDYHTVLIKHLTHVGDNDYIAVTALPSGTFSYENKNGDERTVQALDFGRVCDRDEIPDAVLNGQVASADLPLTGTPQKDVVATLPDSADLVKSGSGFFVSADGYLVTNHHVVKGARRLQVKTDDGTYPATVVRVDEASDLALVKVTGTFKPLHVSSSDVELGDQVFTIGFPDVELEGTQPKYTMGTVSSLAGIKDDPTEYQISVPVQPGNSGGPLADMAGNVKGVIVARLDELAALRSMGSLPQNVNYAVKGNLLRDFLKTGGEVDLSLAPVSEAGTAVATVQKSVALVLVY